MHLPPLERTETPFVSMGNNARYLMSHPIATKPCDVNLDRLHRLVLRTSPRRRSLIKRVEPVPGRHLNQLHIVRLLDDTRMVLKSRPLPSVRLLRHEHDQLEIDAQLLHLVAAKTSVPVPALLCFDREAFISTFATASGALLMSYKNGPSLASASKSLKPSTRCRIDYIVGTHIKAITKIRGPAFGPVFADPERAGSELFTSWKASFTSLMESALRDAEDMFVSIPYSDIRALLQAHSWSLDEIETPFLVPLEAGLPANVLIDEQNESVIAMLGLGGNAIFGDPMLAAVFIEPSEAFWEGFGRRRSYTNGEKTRTAL